jgi:hypothetical protein
LAVEHASRSELLSPESLPVMALMPNPPPTSRATIVTIVPIIPPRPPIGIGRPASPPPPPERWSLI